jgi:hypothetical protein
LQNIYYRNIFLNLLNILKLFVLHFDRMFSALNLLEKPKSGAHDTLLCVFFLWLLLIALGFQPGNYPVDMLGWFA